jgi:hypothetical protein
MMDPFNYSACIPDGAKYVKPFTVKQIGTILTGTTGNCYGIALGLQPDAFYYLDSLTNLTTPTTSGNWSFASAINMVTGSFAQYRVVSAGLKLTYTGSTLSDQGTIITGQMSSQDPLSTLSGATLTNFAASCANYHIGALRSGSTVTWRPEDINGQADFFDVASAPVPTTTVMDHSYLFAWVYGGANAGQSSCQYEIVVNFEGYMNDNTYIPGGISAQPVKAEPGWFEYSGNMLQGVAAATANIMPTLQGAASIYGSLYGRRG